MSSYTFHGPLATSSTSTAHLTAQQILYNLQKNETSSPTIILLIIIINNNNNNNNNNNKFAFRKSDEYVLPKYSL